jgi:hypothetical protein
MEQFKSKSQEQTLKERREVAEKERMDHRKQEKEMMQNVRLPDIRHKKEEPVPAQKQPKPKAAEQKEYYSYKSPNFKQQADPKNSYSLQI